jgi:diacylglycerol kinase (ATP)
MSRKFLYLINPISGTGRKALVRTMISQRTTQQKIPFEIMNTEAGGDYSGLPAYVTREGITDVIACGGDGTISAVAAHLRQVKVNIGIIPMGSGNGLALAAGIPATPSKALDIVFKGNASAVDGFSINDKFSCMLCGIGFDATVAHDFAKQKRRGLQTYIRISAVNYFKAVPYRFQLSTPNSQMDTEAYFVCIANGNQFGNNFTIAPRASLHDGLLDIVIVKKMNKFLLPFSIISQATGNNAMQDISGEINNNTILYFQTDSIRISNPDNALLHIDGDPVDTAQDFDIRVIPGAINLLQP